MAVAGLSGCSSSKQQTLQRPLTKPELEEDMAQRLGLRDVTLTDQGNGRFTGTGQDSEGRLVELEIKQEERRRSWKTRWKSPDGKSGGNAEGSVSW
jgi:hypothetical protein